MGGKGEGTGNGVPPVHPLINIFDIYLQVCTDYCFIRSNDLHKRAASHQGLLCSP